MTGEEAVQRRDRHRHTCLAQLAAQFVQRDVPAVCVQRQDRVSMRLDPPRPDVVALRIRGIAPSAAALVAPADHRRDRHPEPPRRGPAAQPLINRRQRPRPQIYR